MTRCFTIPCLRRVGIDWTGYHHPPEGACHTARTAAAKHDAEKAVELLDKASANARLNPNPMNNVGKSYTLV